MPTITPGAGDTVYIKFTTRDSTGLPTVLTGSPAISIYKDGSTTESTAGVSLTASFDSRVGLNHIAIDTSADGTFYANGSKFYAVITTGTVAGISVVGEVVGEFNLAAALGPAAGGVTLADAVAHGGTPGSSTCTIAAQVMRLENPSASALVVHNATGAAISILASNNTAIDIQGKNGVGIYASNGIGLEISATGGPAVAMTAYTGAYPGVLITGAPTGQGIMVLGGSVSGDAILATATDGSGVKYVGGNGKPAVVPGTLAIGS